jgi:glutathione S-transferase
MMGERQVRRDALFYEFSLERHVPESHLLDGDEITAADLAVYPIYAGRKALPDNAGLKHLQAWGERIGSRPGVQKGMKLEN